MTAESLGGDHEPRVDPPLDVTQTVAIWYASSPMAMQLHVVKPKAFACRFNQLTQGVYLTLPYTLAVYMVRQFEGASGNEESVGRNTGLLVC